jgi:hypothetical protein
VVGRSLLAGLVRAVAVVVADVSSEHLPQVPFVVDQYPGGALGPDGAHPSLGMAVGPWRLRRNLGHFHGLIGEDLVEGAGELGVTVADEEADEVILSPRSMTVASMTW